MDVLENNFFIDKINKVKSQLGNRKGPNIKWMLEKENDDIFMAPDHTFTNGIPTLARTLSDFESGIVCIAGQPNMGKAQPLNSEVLTPNGFVKMGSLKLGDILCSPSGGITKITGIFPQGIKDIYKVILNDGSFTYCCNGHLWTTEELESNSRKKQHRKEASTKELSYIKTSLTKRNRPNHKLPHYKPCYFSGNTENISPYIMGALLGDGSFRDSTPKITNIDSEILDRVRDELPEGYKLNKQGKSISYSLVGTSRKENIIAKTINKFSLQNLYSHEKFIPKKYLLASEENRIALLQGLLDTDATISKDWGTIEFCTASKKLAEDITFLVRSLGGNTRININTSGYRNKRKKFIPCKLRYRVLVALSPSIQPFYLSRKKDLIKQVYQSKQKSLNRTISKVEYVGKLEAQCIKVDKEDGLYFTDNFIVTHNTTCLVNMMLGAAQLQDDTVVVDLSFDDPLKKRYQQYIASLSGLMYQEITTDCGLSDTKLNLKQSAEDKIVQLYTEGKLKTFEATENIEGSRYHMRRYENVFNLMKKLRKENPDKKIIVSIDAWNNLDSSNAKGSELNQVNTQLSELKELSEELNIMILLSAHLRKTTDKRPGIEDIKGTSNMLYDANCAIILRNEYRENLYKDPLLYSEDGKYYPIIVLEVKKTKVSSWDLPLIYGLKSASCQVIPLERYEYIQYYDTLNSKRQ